MFLKGFLVYHQNLSFLKKLTILFLLAKSACANLAAKFSAVYLLNSQVVFIYWSRILFSTEVREVVVAKLTILGIIFNVLYFCIKSSSCN